MLKWKKILGGTFEIILFINYVKGKKYLKEKNSVGINKDYNNKWEFSNYKINLNLNIIVKKFV